MQQSYIASNPYETVPTDGNATPQRTPAEENKNAVPPPTSSEDPTKPQFSLFTRAHVLIGLTSCILSFLIWHYTSENPLTSFWWWIYPFFFFTMTLTAQLHYQNAQYWRGVVMIVVLINFMLFLTNGLTSDEFPTWWIYPSAISAMILLGVHAWYSSEFPPLTTAFYEYGILNMLFFLTWLERKDSFPWWIVPMFLLAIPLIILYMRVNYLEKRIWLYVSVSLVVCNVMFFLVWGFVPLNFPWFIVFWIVSAAIIFLLYWKFGGESTYTIEAQTGKMTSEVPNSDPYNFTVSISPQAPTQNDSV